MIRIKEEDEWKTAFRTRSGPFEYIVMSFSLTNAPTPFQNMMQEIFRELIDHGVVIYTDNILIYSRIEEDDVALVCEVLERLQK